GPELIVYRLTRRTRAAVAALGALPRDWWTHAIAPGYATEASRVLGVPAPPADSTARPDGKPTLWVARLARLFGDRWAGFALALGFEHFTRGDFDDARRLAGAVLWIEPEETRAAVIDGEAAARQTAPVKSPQSP